MNFEEYRKRLDRLSARLQGMDEQDPLFKALQEEIRKLTAFFSSFPTASAGELKRRFDSLQAAWKKYRDSLVIPEGSEVHEELFRLCEDETVNPVKNFLLKTMEMAENGNFLSADTEELKERGGKRITFSEGVTAPDGFAKKSVGELAGKILWVGENLSLLERVCERDGKNYEEEIAKLDQKPIDEYENLMQYLRNAGQQTRIRVALLLIRREQELREKAGKVREGLHRQYRPENGGITTPEELINQSKERNRRVNEDLVMDRSFRDLQSFLDLKKRLMDGPLARELSVLTELKPASEINNFMEECISSLPGTESGQKALEKAAEKDAEDLHTSGFVQTENLFALKATDLLGRMARYGTEGSTWNSIARQLYYLRAENISDLTSKSLRKQAYACLTAAEVYLNDHKRTWSEKGKYRKNLAKEIRESVTELLEKIREADAAQNISAEEANRLEGKNGKSARELSKLARYQSNVGTCRISTEPPVHQIDTKIRTARQAGNLTHTVYSVVKAVEQLNLGLPGNIVGAVKWAKNKKRIEESLQSAFSYDAEHVPGMREERYREPEAGEIITDKRRIPLVWEKPIPGDPNQPITLTFEVDQPFEGEEYSSDAGFEKVGHTFLTLRYSKKNPLTGKMERYQTSFGFYPKSMDGKKASTVQTLGASTIGVPQIGMIMDDNGHTVCAGVTTEITPEQFNDIIRFTGEYEQGGYNMITRNCTTFAVDAIKHAGIRMPEINGVRQTDFVHKGLSYKAAGHAVIDMFSGVLLERENAKSVMAEATQEKETFQYTHTRQNKASKQDLEHMFHSKLNQRLKGYNPGQAGEEIRGSYGFVLHSKKYQGEREEQERAFNQLSEEEKRSYTRESSSAKETVGNFIGKRKIEISNISTAQVQSKYLLALMREEIPRLRREIRGVYGKRNEELNTVLDNIERFQNTTIQALEKFAKNGFSTMGTQCDQRRAALKYLGDGILQIDEYVEKMNQIYRDVFHADSRVNLSFQHTVSLAEYLKGTFENVYQENHDLRAFDTDVTTDPLSRYRKNWYEVYKDLYSESLDMSETLWNVNHIKKTYRFSDEDGDSKEYLMLPSELLATMLAFEDPEEALRKFVFEPKNGTTVSMTGLRGTMVKALETWQDGHEYTEGELKASFLRLPALEEKLGDETRAASSFYQAFAFSNILGNGALGNLNSEFTRLIKAHQEELTPEIQHFSHDRIEDYYREKADFNIQKQRLTEQQLTEEERQILLNQLENEEQELDRFFHPIIEGMKTKFRPYLQQFVKTARDRLEEVLNNLPAGKRAKLDKVTRVIEEDLKAGKEKETGRELSETEKKACRREAGKITGQRLVRSYLASLCRKAVKEMNTITGPDQLLLDAVNMCDEHLRTTEWIPSFFNRVENSEYYPINQGEEEDESVKSVAPSVSSSSRSERNRDYHPINIEDEDEVQRSATVADGKNLLEKEFSEEDIIKNHAEPEDEELIRNQEEPVKKRQTEEENEEEEIKKNPAAKPVKKKQTEDPRVEIEITKGPAKKTEEKPGDEIEITKGPAKKTVIKKKTEEKPGDGEITEIFGKENALWDRRFDENLKKAFSKNEKLLSADMDHVKKLGRNCVLFSREDPAKNNLSKEEVVGQILWLGENMFLAESLKTEGENMALAKSRQLLENALKVFDDNLETENMPYAMLFANRQRQLVRKFREDEKKIRQKVLSEGGGEDRIAAELVKGKSFRNLKTFLDLKRELMEFPFMENPLTFAMKKVGLENEIPDLHTMEQILLLTAEGKKALREAEKKDLYDLRTSGLPVNPHSGETFALIRRLGTMEDQSGESWQEIMNKLALLQTTEPNPFSPVYRQRLKDCHTAAESYLKAHKSWSFTQKGAMRKDAAREIMGLTERISRADPFNGIVTGGGHSCESLKVPGKRAGIKNAETSDRRAASNVIGYLRWKYPAMAGMSAAEMSRTEEYRNAFTEFKDFLEQNAIYGDDGKLLSKKKLASGLSQFAQYNSQWVKALREKRTPNLFSPEVRLQKAGEIGELKQEVVDCSQNMEGYMSVNMKPEQDSRNGQVFYFDYYPKNGKISGADRYREDSMFLINYGAVLQCAECLNDSEAPIDKRVMSRIVLDRYAESAGGKSMEEFCVSEEGAELSCYFNSLSAAIGQNIPALAETRRQDYENYIRNGGEMPEELRALLVRKEPQIRPMMEFLKTTESSIDKYIEVYEEKKAEMTESECSEEENKSEITRPEQNGSGAAGKEKIAVNLNTLEKEQREEDSKQEPEEKTESTRRKDPMSFLEEWKKSDPKVVCGDRRERIPRQEAEAFGMIEVSEEKLRKMQEEALEKEYGRERSGNGNSQKENLREFLGENKKKKVQKEEIQKTDPMEDQKEEDPKQEEKKARQRNRP